MRAFLAACALLGGCAVLQPPPKPAAAPVRLGEIVSTFTAGKSTKTDVRAALGEATVVDFASGYEVWVYRERPPEQSPAARTELVLLFEPSGMLAKKRVR